MPGDVLTIQYKLDPGRLLGRRPVGLDDLVLAWAADSGRFPMFGAAGTAGYSDIDRVDCQPGSKDAVVSSGREQFTDWRSLFGATS